MSGLRSRNVDLGDRNGTNRWCKNFSADSDGPPMSRSGSSSSSISNGNGNHSGTLQSMGLTRTKRIVLMLCTALVFAVLQLRGELPMEEADLIPGEVVQKSTHPPTAGTPPDTAEPGGSGETGKTQAATEETVATSPPSLRPTLRPTVAEPVAVAMTSTTLIPTEAKAGTNAEPVAAVPLPTEEPKTPAAEPGPAAGENESGPQAIGSDPETSGGGGDGTETTVPPEPSAQNAPASDGTSETAATIPPPSPPPTIGPNPSDGNNNGGGEPAATTTTTTEPAEEPTGEEARDPPHNNASGKLPAALSDAQLSQAARKFAETHCDLTNLKDGQWYPSGGEDSWKQRAPYLIVAGVWNAGVNPLARALLRHPQVVPSKQEGFFLPKQFQKYIDVVPASGNQNQNATASESRFRVKVFAARERMYAQVYSKSSFQEKAGSGEEAPPAAGDANDNNNDGDDGGSKRVAMDVSPGLIFYAHKTAHSILCTAPWVKVVVVLRNPIDRLYQQWVYSTERLGLKLPLEDWMALEMKVLQKVGLINRGDEANDAVSEKEAWRNYQSVHNMAGVIGRSLYVFQLEEWIEAFVAAGKNPSEEIVVLTTEEIEEDPSGNYSELMRFLGLSAFDGAVQGGDGVATELQKSLLQRPNDTALPPMKEETRNMLKQFFQPYNERLAKLLRSNGFEGDWDTRWKQ